MNFYLNKNGQKLGPYSVEQIQIFLKQGLVTTADQVWAEGWSSWMPIANVPGLATAPSSGPAYTSSPVSPQPGYSPVTTQPPQPGVPYASGKNPVVACVLSLVIVGTGQFYNGDWGKGWFMMFTCVFATIFSFGTLWLVWAFFSALDAYRVADGKKPIGFDKMFTF